MKLIVNLKENSYPIYIERGIRKKAAKLIREVWNGKRIIIVSDDQVYEHYGEELLENLSQEFSCTRLVLPHGEGTKSFQNLPLIYNAMLKARLSRSDLLVALGGGVIGDLAGFAAATYLRGIPFVQIPTSLLAQVDSSVGGKVAVDLPQGKNLVGAFYQPKLVLIDPDVLDTLPERFLKDGMGEVIKYGCIKDAVLFEKLESLGSYGKLGREMEEIIYHCVDIKRKVVEEDQFDKGERMLLNFGHTLAHAIEQYFHYERESHGEAVAEGMYQVMRIAEQKGIAKSGIAAKIAHVLNMYGLPCESGIPVSELIKAICLDKKNLNNHLNLILLKNVGESYIYQTDTEFFDGIDKV